jgi:hypothetical protein
VALTVKVPLAPTITVRFVGWLVIVTGTVMTVKVAAELISAPTTLLTIQ